MVAKVGHPTPSVAVQELKGSLVAKLEEALAAAKAKSAVDRIWADARGALREVDDRTQGKMLRARNRALERIMAQGREGEAQQRRAVCERARD